MTTWLWWGLAFPQQSLLCCLRQWRSQRQFWRSQLFYGGRLWLGPTPLPDKLRRWSRRHCADSIALCFDCAPPRLELLREACRHAGQPEAVAQAWELWLSRSQQSLQQGLLRLGREAVGAG